MVAGKVPTSYYYEGFAWVSVDWVYTANTENVQWLLPLHPPRKSFRRRPPPCELMSFGWSDPADYTVFAPSYGFGMTWTLKTLIRLCRTRVGQIWSFWERLLVSSHQNGDVYDITASVNPGETYTVQGSLITPATPGEYGEAWSLQQDGVQVCTFWVIVDVQ